MDWHPLEEAGHFESIDRHFAELMAKLADEPSPLLKLACAEASAAIRRGDSCADLSEPRIYESAPEDGPAPKKLAELPGLAGLLPHLSSAVVGRPGERKPLVLDGNRLYLFRYYDYEKRLAACLRARAAEPAAAGPGPGPLLQQLFPESGEQRAAAEVALRRRLTILTGGPGTGKTYTAARILAALYEAAPGERRPRVALCAPTGKAAAKLAESVEIAKQGPAFPAAARDGLPAGAMTLHRLLGSVSGSRHFRHDAQHCVPYDTVVVDEASMVDLSLMTKFFEALPPDSRVILLGDKDQLSSVEAGNVLSDLCAAPSLAPCLATLTTGRRFSKGGIGELSRRINAGEAPGVLELLQAGGTPHAALTPHPSPEGLKKKIWEKLAAALSPFIHGVMAFKGDPKDIPDLLGRLHQFKILCALRGGPFGAEAVNHAVENSPALRDLRALPQSGGEWYPGRPILVSQNNYGLGLFNGDLGLTLPDPESGGELKVFFPSFGGQPRGFLPRGLPSHETAFASTVHKAQGSEFEEVLLILPDRWSGLLSRPLLYTAVTRAAARIEMWSPKNILEKMVETPGARISGLREALAQ